MKFPDSIILGLLPILLPILADQADEAATAGNPLAAKRLAYAVLVSLGSEGPTWLAKVHSHIPLKVWEAAYAEALEEFGQAGIEQVPAQLDAFIAFAAA